MITASRATATLTCGLVLAATTVFAQTGTSSFEISGTSTVRGWSCPVDGEVEVTAGGGATALPGYAQGVQAATIVVQVAAIDCPEEEMTEHLREAMEEPSHPEIRFQLDEYSVDGSTAQVSGDITIHGVTAPITLEMDLEETGSGLRGVGSTDLDMTDFGVTPPSVFLGLLNVGEVITIDYDVTLPGS